MPVKLFYKLKEFILKECLLLQSNINLLLIIKGLLKIHKCYEIKNFDNESVHT